MDIKQERHLSIEESLIMILADLSEVKADIKILKAGLGLTEFRVGELSKKVERHPSTRTRKSD